MMRSSRADTLTPMPGADSGLPLLAPANEEFV